MGKNKLFRLKDLNVPHGDILIHAGDFTNTGEKYEIEELSNFLSLLPHKYKIVIAGNHDITFEKSFYENNWKRFHLNMENSKYCKAALQNCIYLEV